MILRRAPWMSTSNTKVGSMRKPLASIGTVIWAESSSPHGLTRPSGRHTSFWRADSGACRSMLFVPLQRDCLRQTSNYSGYRLWCLPATALLVRCVGGLVQRAKACFGHSERLKAGQPISLCTALQGRI
jgi:hypothetical protein